MSKHFLFLNHVFFCLLVFISHVFVKHDFLRHFLTFIYSFTTSAIFPRHLLFFSSFLFFFIPMGLLPLQLSLVFVLRCPGHKLFQSYISVLNYDCICLQMKSTQSLTYCSCWGIHLASFIHSCNFILCLKRSSRRQHSFNTFTSEPFLCW